MAVSGLTFSLFLRKAAGIGGAVNTLFSVAYALSAYSVVYGFNLMWIDGVVLLPLVMLGAVHLFRTRRMAPFILALAVLFVCELLYCVHGRRFYTTVFFRYTAGAACPAPGKRSGTSAASWPVLVLPPV